MGKKEEYEAVKKISDKIIEEFNNYNDKIISKNGKFNTNLNLDEFKGIKDNKKINEYVDNYNKDVDIYNKNIKKKNKKLKRIVTRHNNLTPPIANFEDNDFVVNLMGINPSTDEKESNSENKSELEYLNLCYVPGIDIKKVKGILEKYLGDIGKGDPYICSNTNYINGQYKFWVDIKDTKYIKMHWQKFDDDFIDKMYKNNKDKAKVENFKKIINELKEEMNKLEFEERKYFIFTDLFYVANRNQDSLNDFINENTKGICELFDAQLNYYQSKLTIVANSHASKFVRENIVNNDKNGWKQVETEEGMIEYSNIYRKNIGDEKKAKYIYVYLANRYWDRKDIAFKNLIKMDVKKLIRNIDEENKK